mgnify:CR=1 FL=1
MFSWGLMLTLVPDIIPLMVSTIMSVEKLIKGFGQGSVKKEKVMDVIKAVLQTKDYFDGMDSAQTTQIYALVSQAIDFFVGSFNYLGLFKSGKKVDFTPKVEES